MFNLFKYRATAAVLALVFSSSAFAQDGFLEEVVVTATKRAQTLQETPIAVTVTSADTIEKAQIQDLLDIQTLVPSLRVSQLQSSRNGTFIIRGFGNGANNVGIEPSVGVFIDGVYRSRTSASISDLPRLERVEVLSGPQNTLFGKNASAGVVSVVTPTPSGESGGFISGSFGNRDAVVLKGLYEGAFSDNLSFDISGTFNTREGFFENQTLGTELNERNRFGVRGQLYWTPSEDISVRVLADYDEIDETCCGVVNIVSGPATGLINALGGQLVPNDPTAEFGFFDDDAVNQIENFGVSIQTDYDLEMLGGVTATSILSYRTTQSLDDQDIDFSSADLTNGNVNDIDIRTITSEFRLASNGDGAVDWLVGGFFFAETIDQDTAVILGPLFRPFIDFGLANSPLAGLFAPLGLDGLVSAVGPLGAFETISGQPVGSFFQNNSGVFDQSTLDNQSISIFANFDWHISDSLTATFGANFTDDEKDFSITSQTTEGRASTIIPGLIPGAALGLPVPFVPLNSLIPSTIANTIDIPNAVEDGNTSDSQTTFTARLAYDISDSWNVYGSYATGYKAPSIDLLRDSAPTAADFASLAALGLTDPNSVSGSRFAEPEDAEVFEIGLKGRFDRGSLNVAIFDQTLENFQSAVFLGTSFFLANAEQQSVTGAEIDFQYQPTDSFGFGVKATLLDPIFDSFTGATPLAQVGATPVSGEPQDLSGQTPAGISEVALSVTAQYDFRVGNFDSYIRGDFQFEDEVNVVDGIPDGIATREVGQLNLALGFRNDNGLSVTLWGRNVNDDEFLISAFPSVAQAGSISGYRNEPRTFGVTIRKDY